MNSRLPSRRGSSGGQADVATIIILASLCVAVFACFFLLGRASSPHSRAPAAPPPTVAVVAAGVPVRMSTVPAIAPAIPSPRSRHQSRSAARTPPAVAAALPVVTAAEPVIPEPGRGTSVRTNTPGAAPNGGRPRKPASSGGPGTSFDTSG